MRTKWRLSVTIHDIVAGFDGSQRYNADGPGLGRAPSDYPSRSSIGRGCDVPVLGRSRRQRTPLLPPKRGLGRGVLDPPV